MRLKYFKLTTHFNISHSLNRNTITASQEQKELLLIFKWKLVEGFPEPPKQTKTNTFYNI